MNKLLYTILLSFALLVPQGAIKADSDVSIIKKNKSEKTKSIKTKHGKFFKRKHGKFSRVPFATKEELASIIQDIIAINASLSALESEVPDDLAAMLAALQSDIDALVLQVGVSPEELATELALLQEDIDANTSGVTLALDDITDIRNVDIVDIQQQINVINDRLFELESSGVPESDLVFSGVFTQGIEADANTQQAWVEFRSNATGPFTSIEISNTLGQSFKCDNPTNATLIAMALNSTNLITNNRIPPLSLECDTGTWWNVGVCGLSGDSSIELNVGRNRAVCLCNAQDAVIRPRKDGVNWGGIGGVSCIAPNQTMEVILSR